MDRQEQYEKILDEDNTMLVEENEILRNKLTAIANFIEKAATENSTSLKKVINVGSDYFIGRRSILAEIKQML